MFVSEADRRKWVCSWNWLCYFEIIDIDFEWDVMFYDFLINTLIIIFFLFFFVFPFFLFFFFSFLAE